MITLHIAAVVAIRLRDETIDPDYPGTAVARATGIIDRAKAADFSGDWQDVRRSLLETGGLADVTNAEAGEGNTSHCFNDFNHVDLTAMLGDFAENENDGSVDGIAVGNQLGPGIEVASL